MFRTYACAAMEMFGHAVAMMSFHHCTFSTSPIAASAAAATTSPAQLGARADAPSDRFPSRRMPSRLRSRVATFAATRRARTRDMRQPSLRAKRTDRKSAVPAVPSDAAKAAAADATTRRPPEGEITSTTVSSPRAVSSAAFAEAPHAPARRLCTGPAGPSASNRAASSSRESPRLAHDPRGANSPKHPSDGDAMRTSHPATRSRKSVASTPAASATATAHATAAATSEAHRAPPIARASQWRTARVASRRCRTPPRRQ